MPRLRFVAVPALVVLAMTTAAGQIRYPDTRKADQVDDYFGRTVADPYRWLEDDNSAETAAWVEAQNKVTFDYLAKIPARETLRARLTTLWNFERYGVPSREGDYYLFSRNDGLQNQSVVYRTRTLDATPEVLIDPNALSADGTVALADTAFTDDGKLMAYALARSGSDWHEWRVRDVATGKDLPDEVRWSKFSNAAWLKDGSGFYYGRFDEPQKGQELQGVNQNHKIFFHKLGTPQSADTRVYQRPDHPTWGFNPVVTDDGRYLLVYQSEGTENKNRIFVQDLATPGAGLKPFLDAFDASYSVVGNDGATFYVVTDHGAPRNKLVAISLDKPEAAAWKTLVAEGPNRDVLDAASMIGDRFVLTWLIDARHTLRTYALGGAFEREVALPTLGTVSFSSHRRDKEGFYSFTSYTYPSTVYRYDPASGTSRVFRQLKLAFTPSDYETTQVFYTSKDGTKVPMFVTGRKGFARDGKAPTYLYGYGGFNISLTPTFSVSMLAWLEQGGLYAVPSLRGGGEYGKAWHDAGRLANKQNVFDDFIAAAEYLIKEKYTSTPRLAIAGGSNGGLLVGACMVQRPDLFGAALPAVGVLDMLRFHRFTIGWAWKSDYGSSETKEGFETLIKYSPLQNLKPGTKYPATLVTTGDHDDRVVPAHSFKFAAALQAAQGGPAPVMIRIETKAGHGAGKPTSKQIEERADTLAFALRALGVEAETSPAGPGGARSTP
jgi:prolyl oligopeptidase